MNKLGYLCYEQYKESGVEWLEKIPGKWDTRRLKRCVTLANRKCDDSALPYVGLENVESFIGRYLPATGETQPDVADSFAETDVLFGKLRPYLAKVLALDFGGRCTGEFLALRPRDFLDRRYLFHCCLSHGFVNIVNSSTFGSKMPRADWQFIGKVCMPLPSIAEQRAIADFLDRETAKIDALIERQERLIVKLEEKRKAMIAQAVTRGLDPNVPLKESGVEWLGKIPEHWGVSRLTYLFSERDERAEPNLPLLNVSISSGVTVREFSDSRIETMAADFNIYKVARKGDIAFNKMRMWQGAVGVAPVHGLVSPDYTVAHDIGNTVVEYYDALFHIERFFVEVIGRSHGIVWDRLRLYWDGFKDIRVPVPPRAEQAAIVANLQALKSRTDACVSKIRELVAKLRERRTALISAAVTGKIDVREHHQLGAYCHEAGLGRSELSV